MQCSSINHTPFKYKELQWRTHRMENTFFKVYRQSEPDSCSVLQKLFIHLSVAHVSFFYFGYLEHEYGI